ncbi:unnamed protein product [Absidia cylindrospora]
MVTTKQSADTKCSSTSTSTVGQSMTNLPNSSTNTSNNGVVLQPPSLDFLPFVFDNKPYGNDYHALLSNLSQNFIYWVKTVNGSRKLFCTEEYPLSFTGAEAVQIIRALVSEGYKEKFYRNLGRTLMALDPALFEPLPYSEKSLKKNLFYDSATEFYTLKESTLALGQEGLAQGISYALSRCYAPRCFPGDDFNPCYSPCCPNKTAPKQQRQQLQQQQHLPSASSILRSNVHRTTSLGSSLASSHDTALSRAWSAMIPREILQHTSEAEVKRQEAIHELIYTEEDYVRDLNLLDDLFAKPLTTAQCLEPERRIDFCDKVFANYMDILVLHRNLYNELRDYQSACQAKGGFVDHVANILLNHIPLFESAYLQYGPNVVLADYMVKQEASKNILFQNFIREKEKQAETRKLPFRHFLVLPVTRLQRYSLLLDAVHKRTPNDQPDKKELEMVTSTIVQMVKRMDQQTAESKRQLRLLQIHDQLEFKTTGNSNSDQQYQQQQQQQQWTVTDLQLLSPDRRLIYEGTVTRRSQLMESSTVHLFLFDHMLIITKPKKSNNNKQSLLSSTPPPPPLPSHGGGSTSVPINPITSTVNPSVDYYAYVISKSPIPLNLLHIQGTEGFALGDHTLIQSHKNKSIPGLTIDDSNPLPSPIPSSMRFKSLQGASGPTPFTLCHIGRHGHEYTVYADLPQQQLLWKEHIMQAKAQWENKHHGQHVFGIRCLTDHTFGPSLSAGKVTASMSFVSASDKRMVVASTSQGLWMGSIDGSIPFQQVMVLANITQIDIMQENHLLLILADKTLTAYALELLDPSTTKKGYAAQKVSQHVQFFSCGKTMGRSLLVTMKRKGMDSHFKTYEPYCGDLRDPKNSKFLNNKAGFLGKAQPWFRLYKPFYIGAEATNVQLLKARLAIVCERGFEIIDLDALHDIRNLPDTVNDRDFDFLMVAPGGSGSGSSSVKPLAMFKCREGFLLCYDAFFFLVDYKGSHYRKHYDKVEWVGNPQQVAFYYPYIVAFDSQMIEVRHVESGELIQVLAGNNMHCLCSVPSSQGMQGVMTNPYDSNYQYMFELLPSSS